MTAPLTRTAPAEMLAALAQLFEACAQREIPVSHWKSNSHLAAALAGDTDLDLLVAPADADRFRALLDDLDYRLAQAAPGKDYPNVENWLGWDRPTGRLIHLHVYYELVLGQRHVKDARLPLAPQMLDHTRCLLGAPVPEPEIELAVLSVRVLLKYRLRDAIKDSSDRRGPGIPRHISDELRWLLDQTTAESRAATFSEVADVIPVDVVETFLDRFDADPSGVELLRLRTSMRHRLRSFQRVGRPAATLRYATALSRKHLPTPRRRMARRGGGLTIAVIGADGAGKSTLVQELQTWLGWRYTVRTAYMGTNEPGRATAALKLGSKRSRTVARRLPGGRRGPLHRAADVVLALRRVSEARDRDHRAATAAEERDRGAVVLFDRYPLAAVSLGARAMDGARIRSELDTDDPVIGRLAVREEQLLAGIAEPDVVVALHVDAARSLERSPDHDLAAIEDKAAAVAAIDRGRLDVVDIDANRPLAAVLAEVKAEVWRRL